MHSDFVIQLVGLIASAFIIFAFSHKSDKRFKAIITIGTLFFAGHFFLLGAYAAMVVAFINIFRVGLSIRFHNSNIAMVSFIVIYLVAGGIVYNNPVDLLPVLSGCFGTFAMYKLSGIHLRLFMFIGSGAWLTHNIIFGSIGGIVTELFIQATNTITIFRLYRDKKNEK